MNNFAKFCVLLLLLLCIILAYYSHFVLKTEVVYSHFFYLPIVCAAFLWRLRSLWVALLLGAALVLMHYFSGMGDSRFLLDVVRACMFVVVGIIVALLRERNLKVEKKFIEFSRKMLFMREEEKKRTAIDLHDELGAMVVSANSNLDILEDEIKISGSTGALKHLEQARAVLRKSVGNLKRMAVDLRPPDLDIIGLGAVLKQYCDNLVSSAKINIELNIDLQGVDLPEDISIVLYRVIQESLSNIIKHSGASAAKINLLFDGADIKLDISDNGDGFNTGDVFQNSQGAKIGIEGMRQRVESLGGRFNIKSRRSRGCRIYIVIPRVQAIKK